MQQRERVEKLFPAKTNSFYDTMTSHGGMAGFRVPEYQRTYDWKPEEQIKRLLEDCLNGFYYLSDSNNAEKYTFLATIILVLEESETSFDGTSLSVVDGQQRLTTLILVCCTLIEEILLHSEDGTNLANLKRKTVLWVKKEVEYVCDELFSCVIGEFRGRGEKFPFPRIVRIEKDYRARTEVDADYRSTIGSFLMNFAIFYNKQGEYPFNPEPKTDSAEENRYFRNYKYIKGQLHRVYEDNAATNGTIKDIEYEQIQCSDFQKKPLRDLFKKINVLTDIEDQNRAISDIAKDYNSSGLIRLLLFSHYLMDHVVLTRVETSDEDSAFDIFDALNTTGEPLTALETFKPRIIHFENEKSGYRNSESEQFFERTEKYLNDKYQETEKRQNATKDLIITFAFYLEGHKLSRDLASQRSYLRNIFDKASLKMKRKIVESIAEVAEFRYKYWKSKDIPNLKTISEKQNDILKLCCKFISDMGTSMALPILARYWVECQENDPDMFVDSAKAVTAFLVLRRSATGGTAGIDTDFKKIIKEDSICLGSKGSNPLPSLQELKTILRKYLEAPKIGVKSKEDWINKASNRGLAEHSAHLCRFLILAASHNARPNSKKAGFLIRRDIIPSTHINFLNHETWESKKYASLEHVAPQAYQENDNWDDEIYKNPYIHNTVGNLTLLPRKENSIIGNSSWNKKKIFYDALSSDKHTKRQELLSKAKKLGFSFSKISEELIQNQDSLYILSPLNKVEKWDAEFIKKRTNNILELAWDEIAPWLSY